MDELDLEETETKEVVVTTMPRKSGQDIGNPAPPRVIPIPHEGHRADADAWRRTKDKRYLKKQAKQRVDKGLDDKYLAGLLVARHHD